MKHGKLYQHLLKSIMTIKFLHEFKTDFKILKYINR